MFRRNDREPGTGARRRFGGRRGSVRGLRQPLIERELEWPAGEERLGREFRHLPEIPVGDEQLPGRTVRRPSRRNPRGTHTPGPWGVSKHGTPDYAPQFGIYAEGERNDLATIKNENAEANARLIAAAPDLYDAVEHVLIASEEGGDMNDIDFKMLRSAIAKAEGRGG